MKKLFFKVSILVLSLIILNSASYAAIISSNSIIEAVQYAPASDFEVTRSNGTNLSHTFNPTSGSTLNAKADLTLGAVGSSTFSTDDVNGFGIGSQSIITMYDTLSFSGNGFLGAPRIVDYNLHLDGTLFSASKFDNPYAQVQVRVYDITGLTNWLEEEQFFTLWTDINPVAAAMEISYTDIFERTSDLGVGLHNIDKSVSGSFMVEAGKTYGIRLAANTFSSGSGSYSDFLNTGTFSFTNLNGTSFTSGSGQFLSGVTSVPEPSMLALLGIGLIGLMRYRRYK